MADLTRRTVLTTLGVVGAAAAAQATVPAAAWSSGTPMLRTAADASPTLVRGATFPEGIMAGVPRTDGATLWTRVPPLTGAAGWGQNVHSRLWTSCTPMPLSAPATRSVPRAGSSTVEVL